MPHYRHAKLTRRTAVGLAVTLGLALVSALWGIGRSFVEYRFEEQRSRIAAHERDAEKHMSMERRVDLFVLRQEYAQDLQDIKTALATINEKLDAIQGRMGR